MLKEKIEYFKI